VSVGDPMRLSRRDRKAIDLAGDWLRASFSRSRESHRKQRDGDAVFRLEMAFDALDLGGDVADDLIASFTTRGGHALPRTRTLRARLALLLRALLRADSGDFGRTWTDLVCSHCGRREVWDKASTMVCTPLYPRVKGACLGILEPRRSDRIRRYTALWERA
jgi:hypothetical protein